ncbi:MAG: 5-formyltetrahydrofolate cyclo-ligase [Kiritimatiellia bacterium]
MKQKLREQVQGRNASPNASETIQKRLMAEDFWAGAFQVGLYRSTGTEPATEALLADLLARGAQVAVPVRREGEYGWGWVDADTRWEKGAHGIPEPAQAKSATPSDLRVIVVPGVAFDAQGGRLGHGKGHYDRLLAQSGAFLVGLCFENRLVEAVPMESHDVRMDAVATEKRMLFAPTAAAKLERLMG